METWISATVSAISRTRRSSTRRRLGRSSGTALQTYLPQVKARVSPNAAVRRLHCGSSAPSAADARRRTRTSASKLKEFLPDNDLYLYTANAFVYGVVQEHRDQGAGLRARLAHRRSARDYTMQVADILAESGARGIDAVDPDARRSASSRTSPARTSSTPTPSNVLQVGAHLVELEQRTGTHGDARPRARAALLPRDDRRDGRLLPEPSLHGQRRPRAWRSWPASRCRHGASPPCAATSASCSTSATRRSASKTSRRRCRSSSTRASRSSSCRKPRRCTSREVTDETVEALQPLRQDDLPLADRRDARRRRLDALPEPRGRVRGLGEATRRRASGARTSTCRCSSTTSGAFRIDALRARAGARRCTRRRRSRRQLEIETYTWDVLPDHLKTGDIVDYVCRELEWVRGELGHGTPELAAAEAG